MEKDSLTNKILDEINTWYESKRNKSGTVNTNVMTVGLIVSRRISEGIPKTEKEMLSKSESQVKGLSGRAVQAILLEHNETRQFTSEGGRTSRGSIKLAKEYREKLLSFQEDLEEEKN